MAEKKFPPYVNAHNSIAGLFSKIREAAVPTKFTNDFLSSVLGLTSSSHRALIPLLKRLEFLDGGGAPTAAYKDYRGEKGKSHILAEKIKKAYSDLYQANEYVHTLDKKDLETKVIQATGASKSDQQVAAVTNTFLELVKLSNFDGGTGAHQTAAKEEPVRERKESEPPHETIKQAPFGLSYTINLNLPPTTEIEVFNAIFKSLKENLLDK